MDPTTVTVSASSVLLPAYNFSHQYFSFLISPSPSALSLSQSRNPNPEKCLNLPRQINTIITGEQCRSLRRVQRRDLAVVTHLPAAPRRKPKPKTSSVATHFPAAPTSNNTNVTHLPISSRTSSSDPRRCFPLSFSTTQVFLRRDPFPHLYMFVAERVSFSYFVDLLVSTIPSVAVASDLGFQI